MQVTITGATASGELFEFQAELVAVPAIGDAVQYQAASYTVESSSIDNEGGEVIGGACRLTPTRPGASPPPRCPKTAFIGDRLMQCMHEPNHIGVCQFR